MYESVLNLVSSVPFDALIVRRQTLGWMQRVFVLVDRAYSDCDVATSVAINRLPQASESRLIELDLL